MILRSHDDLSSTPNQLLLGLCTADILFSLPHSFYGMMLPNEVGYYSWNAMGNMATCQIQGFVNAFEAACGTWYNTSLVRIQDTTQLRLVYYGINHLSLQDS